MARIERCTNQECGKQFMVSNIQQQNGDDVDQQPSCPFCRTVVATSSDVELKRWALAEDESAS